MDEQHILLACRKTLDASDDGFLIVDCDGKIAYINQAYCKYLGVTYEQVVGTPVRETIESTHMPEVARDADFEPELNKIHKVSPKQFTDRECYVFVNRANASIDGVPFAGVAQIKFVRNTLKLSSVLTETYSQLQYYKDELRKLAAERYSFEEILGTSPGLQSVKQLALRAAQNDFSVMITGETGTGKELFASAIHYASNRRDKPFIRINCAAIPSELLESELFGYVEGAFTGAKKGGKKGKFELANGGTLFLDEIGEMPLAMQAKILRVLQEHEVECVGADKPIPIDIRVISATNRVLPVEIREKRFREDLYYRLNVIDIHIPPLRQRKEDIDVYIDTFLNQINEKYHTEVRFTSEAKEILLGYNWPGNVRELKNIVERCYVLNENDVISRFSIPRSILAASKAPEALESGKKDLNELVDEFERRILLDEIGATKGNLRRTAANLGIHRTTLYKKMAKLGITRPETE